MIRNIEMNKSFYFIYLNRSQTSLLTAPWTIDLSFRDWVTATFISQRLVMSSYGDPWALQGEGCASYLQNNNQVVSTSRLAFARYEHFGYISYQLKILMSHFQMLFLRCTYGLHISYSLDANLIERLPILSVHL